MPSSLEQLHERARSWTAPISEEAPAGASAKHEPAYEALSLEISGLESPTGAPVNWGKVVEQAGDLLRRSSKDLYLASYLAYGLSVTDGLRGTLTGVTVLTDVLEQYWPSLFPEAKRLRGRANAVGWFVNRMAAALPSTPVAGEDGEVAEALEAAVRRLVEISRARFEEQAPALSPLLEGVIRLRSRIPHPASSSPAPASVPVSAIESKPEVPAAAPVSPAQVPAKSEQPLPPAMVPGGSPGAPPGSADSAHEFLRNIGGSLVETARVLRQAQSSDPLAYRVLRAGLWLHLTQPPAVGAAGRTQVASIPSSLRAQLDRLESHARWAELLEESEGALGQYRFVLELQRYSAVALAGLGASHAPARETVRQEVAALLKRMPGLENLLSVDGTPLADERTQKWLEAEVVEHPAPAIPLPRAAVPEEEINPLHPELRELLASGRVSEALAKLHQQAAAAPNGRARFKARLSLARFCVISGQPALSQALYEPLVAESASRGLDEWEPALSAECLEGLLIVARISQKNTVSPSSENWLHFKRLVQLDPSASLRLIL
ncbi:type VI secretion system protein TssA [Stigmatella sp. ncwal1]|uniref:Type VI secretion system protein TssA n=1 Tax=Stigmatella ashevillensis TaxID=2995309 RepID=A0ABT5DDI6_9BACT|nr:type VI secretion system protein TssA [Stigmatella ashevillena]MDC0711163.1 type VI secretion system protein TssA [Stigmatella ashevillena]